MKSNQQEYNLPIGQTMYLAIEKAMEQTRFLDLEKKKSMDLAIKQAKFSALERKKSVNLGMKQVRLEISNPIDQVIEKVRSASLEISNSIDQVVQKVRLASLEISNPIDQVIQKVRLASLEANNPIDQAIKKPGLAFADLVLWDLARKQVRFAGLETSDPMNLTVQELKLAELAELAVVDAKKTKSTELLTDSKEIKTVLEKETHNLIMPSKDPIIDKMLSTLPEDLQAILEDMQKRWIKKQYSPQKIRYLTFRYLFDMILGYVKSQIENIWLPKSDSTKEIE
jgi:hypothetical protein